MSHTPGPWEAVYVGSSDWDLDGPVTEQDWKLAAAAPDLLEALKEAEMVLAEKLRRLGADPDVSPTTHRIRAAIAKAEGGQT